MHNSYYSKLKLPAEWETHKYIQFTLPILEDSWYSDMPELEDDLIKLISIISQTQDVLVLTIEKDRILNKINNTFNSVNLQNIHFLDIQSNDIWGRDHGVISAISDSQEVLYNNFQFNGWGLKFPANYDNQINQSLYNKQILDNIQNINLILEGGSLDTNGQGILLTTEYCLMSANRNINYSRQDYEEIFSKYLGIEKTIWLTYGALEGDDTDGHIDTLARFVNDNTIVYSACNNPDDSHYNSLQSMKQELQQTEFNLLELPIPLNPIYDTENNRLPATYCNFLITNKTVIVPIYNDPHDKIAIDTLTELFPTREIIPFDSLNLIVGRGSIHCATMNVH